MIAVRRLPREEWEAELRHYGCRPAEGLTPLNYAEWWRYPWGGYPFTVPADEDGWLLQQDMLTIIADMAVVAQNYRWKFPEPDEEE